MTEQRKTPAQKATGAENSSVNIVPQGQAAATGIIPGAYLDSVENALQSAVKTGTGPNFEELIRLALEYGDKGEQGADMLANYLAQVESGVPARNLVRAFTTQSAKDWEESAWTLERALKSCQSGKRILTPGRNPWQ